MDRQTWPFKEEEESVGESSKMEGKTKEMEKFSNDEKDIKIGVCEEQPNGREEKNGVSKTVDSLVNPQNAIPDRNRPFLLNEIIRYENSRFDRRITSPNLPLEVMSSNFWREKKSKEVKVGRYIEFKNLKKQLQRVKEITDEVENVRKFSFSGFGMGSVRNEKEEIQKESMENGNLHIVPINELIKKETAKINRKDENLKIPETNGKSPTGVSVKSFDEVRSNLKNGEFNPLPLNGGDDDRDDTLKELFVPRKIALQNERTEDLTRKMSIPGIVTSIFIVKRMKIRMAEDRRWGIELTEIPTDISNYKLLASVCNEFKIVITCGGSFTLKNLVDDFLKKGVTIPRILPMLFYPGTSQKVVKKEKKKKTVVEGGKNEANNVLKQIADVGVQNLGKEQQGRESPGSSKLRNRFRGNFEPPDLKKIRAIAKEKGVNVEEIVKNHKELVKDEMKELKTYSTESVKMKEVKNADSTDSVKSLESDISVGEVRDVDDIEEEIRRLNPNDKRLGSVRQRDVKKSRHKLMYPHPDEISQHQQPIQGQRGNFQNQKFPQYNQRNPNVNNNWNVNPPMNQQDQGPPMNHMEHHEVKQSMENFIKGQEVYYFKLVNEINRQSQFLNQMGPRDLEGYQRMYREVLRIEKEVLLIKREYFQYVDKMRRNGFDVRSDPQIVIPKIKNVQNNVEMKMMDQRQPQFGPGKVPQQNVPMRRNVLFDGQVPQQNIPMRRNVPLANQVPQQNVPFERVDYRGFPQNQMSPWQIPGRLENRQVQGVQNKKPKLAKLDQSKLGKFLRQNAERARRKREKKMIEAQKKKKEEDLKKVEGQPGVTNGGLKGRKFEGNLRPVQIQESRVKPKDFVEPDDLDSNGNFQVGRNGAPIVREGEKESEREVPLNTRRIAPGYISESQRIEQQAFNYYEVETDFVHSTRNRIDEICDAISDLRILSRNWNEDIQSFKKLYYHQKYDNEDRFDALEKKLEMLAKRFEKFVPSKGIVNSKVKEDSPTAEAVQLKPKNIIGKEFEISKELPTALTRKMEGEEIHGEIEIVDEDDVRIRMILNRIRGLEVQLESAYSMVRKGADYSQTQTDKIRSELRDSIGFLQSFVRNTQKTLKKDDEERLKFGKQVVNSTIFSMQYYLKLISKERLMLERKVLWLLTEISAKYPEVKYPDNFLKRITRPYSFVGDVDTGTVKLVAPVPGKDGKPIMVPVEELMGKRNAARVKRGKLGKRGRVRQGVKGRRGVNPTRNFQNETRKDLEVSHNEKPQELDVNAKDENELRK